jgi:putative hydrolase of the HAD superfamily
MRISLDKLLHDNNAPGKSNDSDVKSGRMPAVRISGILPALSRVHCGLPETPDAATFPGSMNNKYFIFDIGNVLVDFNFQVLLQQIATDSGTPVEQPTERDLEMHYAVEEGVISDQEFVDYLNEAKGLSWTVDTLIDVWRKMFTVNQTGYGLFREAIERSLPVYTLSNIAEHHIEAIERNWPGFFDGATGLFLSYEVGARKPNAGIYRHMLENLGVSGNQCLFLDDRPENVEAARAAGIHALQFIPENHFAIHDEVLKFFG